MAAALRSGGGRFPFTSAGVVAGARRGWTARSNAYAIESSRDSVHGGPSSSMPIGTPSAVKPAGTLSAGKPRSEEHTSELQSQSNLVCRLLLEKKKNKKTIQQIIKHA